LLISQNGKGSIKRRVLKFLIMNKNTWLLRIIIFVIILGTYLVFSITQVNNWRKRNIESSPKVYITKTGEKYHRAYHYRGRNIEISLFEANEKGYDPCMVCLPPIAPEYDNKPKFYIYNWRTFSILISILYWLPILYFYWKNSNK